MPSWPSSNKAVTTALDSQNDDPNLARPEIKKNVDNVNDIIDFINDTSLADGDILQYVNANTRFENKTLASAGIEKTVLLTLATNTGQGSVNFYRFRELSDPYNLATIDSDGKLLLATGTYTIQGGAMIDQGNYDSHPFFTKDGSASEVLTHKQSGVDTFVTNNENYVIPLQKFVVTSATHTYFIRFDSSSISTPFEPTHDDVIFKITKIS